MLLIIVIFYRERELGKGYLSLFNIGIKIRDLEVTLVRIIGCKESFEEDYKYFRLCKLVLD